MHKLQRLINKKAIVRMLPNFNDGGQVYGEEGMLARIVGGAAMPDPNTHFDNWFKGDWVIVLNFGEFEDHNKAYELAPWQSMECIHCKNYTHPGREGEYGCKNVREAGEVSAQESFIISFGDWQDNFIEVVNPKAKKIKPEKLITKEVIAERAAAKELAERSELDRLSDIILKRHGME